MRIQVSMHMGQFAQDGKCAHFVSYFFKSKAFVCPDLIIYPHSWATQRITHILKIMTKLQNALTLVLEEL